MLDFGLENSLKYGNQNNDIIATIAKIDTRLAISFCIASIQKYATRYISQSTEKAFNSKDLLKISDYANRALELADKQKVYLLIQDILLHLQEYQDLKEQGKIKSQYYFTQIIDSCIAIYSLI